MRKCLSISPSLYILIQCPITEFKIMHFLLKAFGTSAEQVERLISQGIINWGSPVAGILEDGELFIQQARSPDTRGLVSVLLEGLYSFILFFFLLKMKLEYPMFFLLTLVLSFIKKKVTINI